MMPMNPMMGMNQQVDPNQQAKDMFKSRIENLSLVQHHFALNPIVSFKRNSFPVPMTGSVIKYNFHTLVPSVANNLFSASIHLLVK